MFACGKIVFDYPTFKNTKHLKSGKSLFLEYIRTWDFQLIKSHVHKIADLCEDIKEFINTFALPAVVIVIESMRSIIFVEPFIKQINIAYNEE